MKKEWIQFLLFLKNVSCHWSSKKQRGVRLLPRCNFIFRLVVLDTAAQIRRRISRPNFLARSKFQKSLGILNTICHPSNYSKSLLPPADKSLNKGNPSFCLRYLLSSFLCELIRKG